MATAEAKTVLEDHSGIGGPVDTPVAKPAEVTAATPAPDSAKKAEEVEAGRGGPADMEVDSSVPVAAEGAKAESTGMGGPCDMPVGGAVSEGAKKAEETVTAAASSAKPSEGDSKKEAPAVTDRSLPPAEDKGKESWFGKEGVTDREGDTTMKEGEYPKGVSHEAFDKFKEQFQQGLHGDKPGTRGIGETAPAEKTSGEAASAPKATDALAAATESAPIKSTDAGPATGESKAAEVKSAEAKAGGWFEEPAGTKTKDVEVPFNKDADHPKGVTKEGFEKFKKEFEEGVHGGEAGTRGVGEETPAGKDVPSKAPETETPAKATDDATKAPEAPTKAPADAGKAPESATDKVTEAGTEAAKSAGWWGKEDTTKSRETGEEFKEGDVPKGVSKEGFEAFKEQFRQGLHSAKEAIAGVRESGSSFLNDAAQGSHEMRPSVVAAEKAAESTETKKEEKAAEVTETKKEGAEVKPEIAETKTETKA
eukprot:TRINITY_DN6226_c0_g1_i1.p1 TRINITY_DN6226_c0_g1~~TRINITY_DN6226_c0_g1_i1.p1  ORF type:complete len:480 (-),score=126.54 TRINITY_DN6226_c0_g1_i1:779-2218(-)